MILEAKDLTFFYPGGKRPVLEGIQLQIASGERVGLFGPSGRGKTTLCKLLAGYDVPKRGQVLLDGSPLKKYPNPCPVQMIWQHPETVVDPLLPLGVSLGEGGQPDPALLEALHIRKGWLSRYPGELSGGELQRFCLALSSASRSKVSLMRRDDRHVGPGDPGPDLGIFAQGRGAAKLRILDYFPSGSFAAPCMYPDRNLAHRIGSQKMKVD